MVAKGHCAYGNSEHGGQFWVTERRQIRKGKGKREGGSGGAEGSGRGGII